MARKFAKKEFKLWLDNIAKLTCKTDDNFTCQMQFIDCGHTDCNGCSGTMMPLSFECQWCHIKSKKNYNLRWLPEDAVTGCAHCHAYAHDNPDVFIAWFGKKYPHRLKMIDEAMRAPSKVWRGSDFREMEAELLLEAKRVSVDYMNMTKYHKFNMRLKRKLEELKEK